MISLTFLCFLSPFLSVSSPFLSSCISFLPLAIVLLPFPFQSLHSLLSIVCRPHIRRATPLPPSRINISSSPCLHPLSTLFSLSARYGRLRGGRAIPDGVTGRGRPGARAADTQLSPAADHLVQRRTQDSLQQPHVSALPACSSARAPVGQC